ncbi:MAG TPA: ATP-binding cassette domain-containing protein [Trebonia sp.]|jgi:ABC-2 type transport system ATP-binding protein|nr:ATP-binding cassette domain-containing protein [Trebonia sp.]
MIELARVTKRFGALTAVDDLSFTVRPGRVTGFLGPNGAGKTTTMRIILGLDAPTTGTALVAGRRYRHFARPLRQVGSLLDASAVQGARTARDHLLSLAVSNGIGRARVTEVLALTGLDPVAGKRVRDFSLGMKQRLGIAAAMLGDPPVLIFDEPVNALDADGVRWIRLLMRQLAANGHTVFISSHLMSEMAQTADHLIVIGRGRLLADAPTAQFTGPAAGGDVLVRSPRAGDLTELLRARGAAVAVTGDGGLSVTGTDAAAIADLAAARGIPVHELTRRAPSLEQVYLNLTGASTEYRALGPEDRTPAPEGRALAPGRETEDGR